MEKLQKPVTTHNKLANGTQSTETLTWEEEKVYKTDEMCSVTRETLWHWTKSKKILTRQWGEKSKTSKLFSKLCLLFWGGGGFLHFCFYLECCSKIRKKKNIFFYSGKKNLSTERFCCALPASSCRHYWVLLHHSCVHSERLFSPQKAKAKCLK